MAANAKNPIKSKNMAPPVTTRKPIRSVTSSAFPSGATLATAAKESRYPGVLLSPRRAIVDIRVVTAMDVPGLVGDIAQIEASMTTAELGLIEAYAEDMRQGRWLLNGQAICFEIQRPNSWRVVNGLKRLLAVHRARMAIPFVFVVFNAETTQATSWSLDASIDAHRMRRTADYISLLERERSRTLASALAHVHLWRGGAWQRGNPSTHDILRLFQVMPEIKESATAISTTFSAIPGPRPLLTAFHAMLSRISKEKAEQFFSGLASFQELGARDPRRVLATKLAAIGEGGAQATRQELHAFFAKGWNAFFRDEKLSSLRFLPTEEMPGLEGWAGQASSLRAGALPDALQRLFDTRKASSFEGIRVSVVRVTPEGAQSLLKLNTWNRNPSRATISKFVRDMREGNWVFNGASIVISDHGRLIDGQQRLMAVLEAGIPQDFVLVEGVHESVFATIDGNRTRGFAKLLDLKAVPYFKSTAAAVNLLWRIEHGELQTSNSPSMTELLDTFHANEAGLREAAKEHGADHSGLTPGVAIALRYMLQLEDKAKAAKFFEKLSGVGEFREGDPVLVLQRRLVKNKIGGEVGKAPPAERLLWALSAWRDFVEGRKSRGLRGFKGMGELLAPFARMLAKTRRVWAEKQGDKRKA